MTSKEINLAYVKKENKLKCTLHVGLEQTNQRNQFPSLKDVHHMLASFYKGMLGVQNHHKHAVN